jgi:GT2 family glycosyltransferase
MPQVRVTIVIPNWNGRHLLEKHLANVIAASPGCEVVIADDASVDGSVEYLKTAFPRVTVVEGRRQQGFAGNVDDGVAAATGEIVILLNTDVEPEKGWLDPLLDHFADPAVFAVGCLEKSHEKTGVVTRGRGLSRWERGFFVHSRGEVDRETTAWVSGGSGAFRKSVWDRLGGMNRLYSPFYWEDIDLSYCAVKAGYTVRFEPESIVHHWHEEGAIKSSYTQDQVKTIVFRNQFVFHWKNMTDPGLVITHLVWLPVRLAQAVLRRDRIMIAGFFAAVEVLPRIISEKKRLYGIWSRGDYASVLPE